MLIFKFMPLRFAAMLALALPAGPAWALLAVESSDAPGIEADAEFPDDYVFDLPAGATVKLTKTPGDKANSETHTIKGRYKGTLGDYVRHECWRPDSQCGLSGERDGGVPGGSKGLDPSEGGVRAVRPIEPAK